MFILPKIAFTKESVINTLGLLVLTNLMPVPHETIDEFGMTDTKPIIEVSVAQITPETTPEVVLEEAAEPEEVVTKYQHLHTAENEYLLARIIASEYSSQKEGDLHKKVAVGIVVLNRVLSDDFPDTVEGVIFQKNQFQPTFDGSWERNLPTDFDTKAAQLAFAEHKLPNQLNEALFFMNPTISNPKNVAWFRNNLTYVGVLGAHEFYK